MKKYVILGILVLFMTGITTGCKKETEQQNDSNIPQANTNENVIKNQVVDVFSFENTSLLYENGTSTFETTVTNTSDIAVYVSEFKIHLKDEQGNEIVTLTGYIGNQLDAHESRTITSSATQNLMLASILEYEIIR